VHAQQRVPEQRMRPECSSAEMQTLYICPHTNTHVGIDLPADAKSREARWFEPLVIACPACNKLHEADYAEAYRIGVMAEFECLPADIQSALIQ